MKAQIGDTVSLYYDSDVEVLAGHFLQTPTGRSYLVDRVRQQAKGAHIGRWHIRAIVFAAAEIPAGATVHPIYWYRRKKKRG